MDTQHSIKVYTPLLAIIAVSVLAAGARQWYYGTFNWLGAMSDFMGVLLILVALFKLINWKGFVETYSVYDIIAKRSKAWAYAYPFIELLLGVLYLARLFPIPVNASMLVLSLVNSVSVAQVLGKQEELNCGCLGTTFSIPLTKITLIENLLVAGMALVMLIVHLLGKA